MTPKKGPTGSYYSPLPLDFELMRRLPREGAVLGFHNMGLTVHALREILNKNLPRDQQLTGDQISGRLRSMRDEGLAVDVTVTPVGKGRGWQRTPKGERFYKETTGETLPNSTTKLRAVDDVPPPDQQDEPATETG